MWRTGVRTLVTVAGVAAALAVAAPAAATERHGGAGTFAIGCDSGGFGRSATVSCWGSHDWWNVYRAKVTCLTIQSGSYYRYGPWTPLHISPGSTSSSATCRVNEEAVAVAPQYGRR